MAFPLPATYEPLRQLVRDSVREELIIFLPHDNGNDHRGSATYRRIAVFNLFTEIDCDALIEVYGSERTRIDYRFVRRRLFHGRPRAYFDTYPAGGKPRYVGDEHRRANRVPFNQVVPLVEGAHRPLILMQDVYHVSPGQIRDMIRTFPAARFVIMLRDFSGYAGAETYEVRDGVVSHEAVWCKNGRDVTFLPTTDTPAASYAPHPSMAWVIFGGIKMRGGSLITHLQAKHGPYLLYHVNIAIGALNKEIHVPVGGLVGKFRIETLTSEASTVFNWIQHFLGKDNRATHFYWLAAADKLGCLTLAVPTAPVVSTWVQRIRKVCGEDEAFRAIARAQFPEPFTSGGLVRGTVNYCLLSGLKADAQAYTQPLKCLEEDITEIQRARRLEFHKEPMATSNFLWYLATTLCLVLAFLLGRMELAYMAIFPQNALMSGLIEESMFFVSMFLFPRALWIIMAAMWLISHRRLQFIHYSRFATHVLLATYANGNVCITVSCFWLIVHVMYNHLVSRIIAGDWEYKNFLEHYASMLPCDDVCPSTRKLTPSEAFLRAVTSRARVDKTADVEVSYDGEEVSSSSDVVRDNDGIYCMLMHNGILWKPANSDRNLLVATCNRFLAEPKYEPNAMVWSYLIERCHVDIPEYVPWTPVMVLRELRGSGKRRYLHALEEFNQYGVMRKDLSLFAKTNETIAVKLVIGQDGLETYSILPRCISDVPPIYQVETQCHMRGIAKALKFAWDGKQPVYMFGREIRVLYASGSTPAEIEDCVNTDGDFIMVCGDDSLLRVDGVYLEGDFSKFDQSEREDCQALEAKIYLKAGVPRHIVKMLFECVGGKFRASRRTTKFSVAGKVPPVRLTGAANTTLGNSLVNAIVLIFAVSLFNDLDKVPVVLASLGFEWKTSGPVAEPDGLTFLKGLLVTVQGQVRWYPLPSQILKITKLGTDPRLACGERLNKPLSVDHLRACAGMVYMNLVHIPEWYPVLGSLKKNWSQYATGGRLHEAFDFNPHRPRWFGFYDDPCARASVCQVMMWRYATDLTEISELEKLVEHAPVPGFISHSLLRKMQADYGL